jgi:hypothetical protein
MTRDDDAAELATALGGRRSGVGYIARCPGHDDHTPSLSIRYGNSRLLVHCHAGCTQAAVIAALRERGLWPASAARRPSSAERAQQEWMRRVREERSGELRQRHGELCEQYRRAINDQVVVLDLARRDPDGHDIGVAVALEELGEPWLGEQVLATELDALERELSVIEPRPALEVPQWSGMSLDPPEVRDARARRVGRAIAACAARFDRIERAAAKRER